MYVRICVILEPTLRIPSFLLHPTIHGIECKNFAFAISSSGHFFKYGCSESGEFSIEGVKRKFASETVLPN